VTLFVGDGRHGAVAIVVADRDAENAHAAQRFIMSVVKEDAPVQPIHVVSNWTSMLKK
jgi:hypothetical protein